MLCWPTGKRASRLNLPGQKRMSLLVILHLLAAIAYGRNSEMYTWNRSLRSTGAGFRHPPTTFATGSRRLGKPSRMGAQAAWDCWERKQSEVARTAVFSGGLRIVAIFSWRGGTESGCSMELWSTFPLLDLMMVRTSTVSSMVFQ